MGACASGPATAGGASPPARTAVVDATTASAEKGCIASPTSPLEIPRTAAATPLRSYPSSPPMPRISSGSALNLHGLGKDGELRAI